MLGFIFKNISMFLCVKSKSNKQLHVSDKCSGVKMCNISLGNVVEQTEGMTEQEYMLTTCNKQEEIRDNNSLSVHYPLLVSCSVSCFFHHIKYYF